MKRREATRSDVKRHEATTIEYQWAEEIVSKDILQQFFRSSFSTEFMLNETINSVYAQQKRTFDKSIRLAFTCAGVYWLFIYALQWMDLIVHDELIALRSGQTIIYFLLLTLWGVEYMREVRRYKSLLGVSVERSVLPNTITLTDLGASARSFAVLQQIKSIPRSATMPLVNGLLLAVSAFLIVRQYVALIMAAMNTN